MTVLAAGAISITDGAIVITAETVAPQLGVKPEALQAEMQRELRRFTGDPNGVGLDPSTRPS